MKLMNKTISFIDQIMKMVIFLFINSSIAGHGKFNQCCLK